MSVIGYNDQRFKNFVNSRQWCSSTSVYTDTHGSVWRQASILDQSADRRLLSTATALKTLSNSNTSMCFQTLPCIDHCSQSQTYLMSVSTQWPIRGVYESAQQCSKHHIFKISLLTTLHMRYDVNDTVVGKTFRKNKDQNIQKIVCILPKIHSVYMFLCLNDREN